ncbi:MAG: hypothetical protein KF858_09315 [Candidatus Sumerlaeia bacterium]|nr:hypothetical protein [Candidatus Sumerlaeia bacterium]
MNPDRQPVPVALGYCAVNWLVPGGGYLLARDFRRGIALFALLNGIFFGGLLYDGYLVVPAGPGQEGFNIVALLSFLVQACHGGGCLAILGAERMGGVLGGLLVRDAGKAYSDLGAFHFLVAGALNYFATVRLYDLLAGELPAADEDKAKDGAGEVAP